MTDRIAELQTLLDARMADEWPGIAVHKQHLAALLACVRAADAMRSHLSMYVDGEREATLAYDTARRALDGECS